MIRTTLATLCCLTGMAHAELQVATGLDYAQGKYGSAQTTEQTAVPLIVRYVGDRVTARASVPYVWIQNVNPGARGEALPCGNAANTPKNVEGFGDLVTSLSYSVIQNREWLVDVGGKAKWATGDEDKCLSSGKNDFSAVTDIVRRVDDLTLFTTLGWTKRGDPTLGGVRTDYRDPFFGSIGASLKVAANTSIGTSYDYRERLTERSQAIREVSAFVTHRFTPGLKLQVYAVTGFTDASVDAGGGAILTTSY